MTREPKEPTFKTCFFPAASNAAASATSTFIVRERIETECAGCLRKSRIEQKLYERQDRIGEKKTAACAKREKETSTVLPREE
jgi:hypothetical protein